MQKNGVRSIVAPAEKAYGAAGFSNANLPSDASVRFEVTLLDVKPELPDTNNSAYRVMPGKEGAGAQAACGDTVSVHLTVWGLNGKKLFSTHDEGKQALKITPGSSQIALGIEQAIIGMREGASRMIILPPEFQNTMMENGSDYAQGIFAGNETVMVEVEALSQMTR
jgi:FKBP-type peptidyl-prolyl cis-trans isomerase